MMQSSFSWLLESRILQSRRILSMSEIGFRTKHARISMQSSLSSSLWRNLWVFDQVILNWDTILLTIDSLVWPWHIFLLHLTSYSTIIMKNTINLRINSSSKPYIHSPSPDLATLYIHSPLKKRLLHLLCPLCFWFLSCFFVQRERKLREY